MAESKLVVDMNFLKLRVTRRLGVITLCLWVASAPSRAQPMLPSLGLAAALVGPEGDLIYGLWEGTTETHTVYHEYSVDGTVSISAREGSGECKPIQVNEFTYQPGRLRFSFPNTLHKNEVIVKRLDKEELHIINAKGGKETGELMKFRRLVGGHPCDSDYATLEKRGRIAWAWLLLGLLYFVYIFGSLLTFALNVRSGRFAASALGYWLLTTLLLSVLVYASAYGYVLDMSHLKLSINGQQNPRFSLVPIRGVYGEGNIPKGTLSFWLASAVTWSFFLTFPTAVWNSWLKYIGRANWRRLLVWIVNSLVGGSIAVFAVLVALSSAVSPDGPRSWILLVVSLGVLLRVIKTTFWGALLRAGVELGSLGHRSVK